MMASIFADTLSGIFLWVTARIWKFLDIRRCFNPDIIKTMMRFAIPMIPTAVLWIITGFSDRLFVQYMEGFAVSPDVGKEAQGIYEYASKVPNLISMVSTIFFQAWNMSAITENNSKDKSTFYYRIFSAYQAFMFLGASAMILFVKPLSDIIIDTRTFAEYERCYLYTPVLIIAVVMMSFDQFLSSVYVATKKTSHSMWTALIAAGTNIILNIILIYLWGIHGAVIATFASYFVCYLVRIVDTRKLIYFKVSHGRFFLNLAVLFAMSILAIKEPAWMLPAQIVLFGFMIVFNLSAVKMVLGIAGKVVRKITHR